MDENDKARAGTLPGDPEEGTVPMGADGQPLPQPESLVRIDSLFAEALRRAVARRTEDEKPVPVPWPEFAKQLGGGLWPGLHMLIGGTGVGKSALALQIALGAAKAGVPTGYIGLELGDLDIALRVLGEAGDFRWSNLYTGRASEMDFRRAREAATALAGLPFYRESGRANGWPASALRAFVERMRLEHPEKTKGSTPVLIVLDFLQLVGDEFDSTRGRMMGLEMRERISRAAYVAREMARSDDVTVLAISSTARTNYGQDKLVKEAGLRMVGKDARRFVANPDAIVGMGKESGEIEYSADSVNVLLKGPMLDGHDGLEKTMLLVTAKGRATGESWCALRFEHGHHFRAWPGGEAEVYEAMNEKTASEKPQAEPANGVTGKVFDVD